MPGYPCCCRSLQCPECEKGTWSEQIQVVLDGFTTPEFGLMCWNCDFFNDTFVLDFSGSTGFCAWSYVAPWECGPFHYMSIFLGVYMGDWWLRVYGQVAETGAATMLASFIFTPASFPDDCAWEDFEFAWLSGSDNYCWTSASSTCFVTAL